MKDIERPVASVEGSLAWGSDVAAQMLRELEIPYVTLNPGASFRGFHDSLVNYLGNETPQLLLCLNEDHVISIAHGYAKATDKAMAAVLHSNVGLLHGAMGMFNAWCDRMPMVVIGATGPVAPEKRRPWIDWIHTAKDQGAVVRDYTKWDDEPRSAEGLVDGFLRGHQLTSMSPRAPVYICLDAGLQEERLQQPPKFPDVSRYQPPEPPSASDQDIDALCAAILKAERPLFLFGRGARGEANWDRRVELAELVGASVMTSIRERSVFPTDHPLHVVHPSFWLTPAAKDQVKAADLIVSFDWVDLKGFMLQVSRDTQALPAKVAHISLDSILHRGWSMDYFGLPHVDLPMMADPDKVVSKLLDALREKLGGKRRWDGQNRNTTKPADYSENAGTQLQARDVEVALARVRGDDTITLAHVTIGWSGAVYHFRDHLDFLGHDGGAGLAAGPGLTIGAALALKDSGRPVVSVLGDGDFMQGNSALWTAARYGIPALFIISNNSSNFNDELHQEAVAKIRNRATENKWIGQRIAGPELDLLAIARAQGVEGEEKPVSTASDLEAAIRRGLQAVREGRAYFIDARVAPGYASPPLARGE